MQYISKILQNRTLSFILAFLYSAPIFAQSNVLFSKLTINDGLSHNNVYSILQDKHGFVWLATPNGLNRYDGYSFRLFNNGISYNNTTQSNNFSKIIEGNSGNLWIGTNKGLKRYNPISNEFKHISLKNKLGNYYSYNKIQDILINCKSKLWVAVSRRGLYKIDTRNLQKIHYTHNESDSNSISSNDVYSLATDQNNNIWIGTDQSLDFFDTKNKTFKHYIIGYERYDTHKHLTIRALLLDTSNLLWIGTSDGLFTLNVETDEIKQYRSNVVGDNSISDNSINAFFEDSEHNIWIATDYGLNKYSKKTNKFTSYFHSSSDLASLNHNKIISLYEDKSHVLWIGTEGGGVNMLDLKRKKFYSWHKANRKIANTNISSILVLDSLSMILLGTNGGGVSICTKDSGYAEWMRTETIDENLITDDEILSLSYYKGRICIGMQTGGLGMVVKKNKKCQIKSYKNTNDSTSISNNQVNAIITDKDGFLWIATRDGLNKMIDTNKKASPYFIHYKQDFSQEKSLCDNYITTLFQDKQGFLWVGTYNKGVDRINISNFDITHFEHELNNTKSLSSNNINHITQDSSGNIWISTADCGLNKMEPGSTNFTRYNTTNGLASNVIMSILEDSHNNLWISTSKGITKLNTKTLKATKYDVSDGILNDGFNKNAGAKDSNGWMYFGTNSGLVYFHPDQIKYNQVEPNTVITNFTILDDKKWTTKDLFISKYNAKNKEIELEHDENIFSIEFASLDYTNPGKNKYQYKIEEINNEWIDYGTQRKILITGLPSGEYTFRVRSSNNDGIFNKNGVAINIIVNPSFSETKVFHIIMFIIIVSILIWIYSYLIKIRTNKMLANTNAQLESTNLRLIESEKNLKLLNQSKDKFFSIIAHDLRNPFSPLLSLTELLDDDYEEIDESERREYIKEIRHGAKRLYDLLENLLHWSLSQTKRIKFKPKILNFSELVDINIDILTINAEKKDIELVKNFDGEYNIFADENMINSVVRNLLNNAIKFSHEKSEIIINLEETDNNYIIEIKDHGIGITDNSIENIFKGLSKSKLGNNKASGSGLGLILCHEFVEKNGGKIWAESIVNKGSSFFFSLQKAQKNC